MKVYNKIVLQMNDDGSFTRLFEDSFEYEGPVELCGGGGDPVAQQNEQLQNQFDQQLMSIFNQQYANQSGILNFLKTNLEPSITAGGTGYTPDQLASLRTSASDTNAQQFQNAEEALNNQISQASGGSKLAGVAGATQEAKAALDVAGAEQEANSQNAITQANANLQQQNYWASINALNGISAQVNPLGYGGEVQNGAGAVSSDSNANSNAQMASNSWMGPVFGAVGGAAGGLFGNSKLFCWIFASFFGWNDIRTWVMRMWLLNSAPMWFHNFYLKFGERISKTHLRWAFYPIAASVLAVE